MPAQRTILTAAAYIILTFGVAILWHLVAFKSFYNRIGYFGEKDPIIALGLFTIVIQGVLVAYVYPFFQRGGKPLTEAARVAAVFGVNTASIQVIAAAAKHHAPASPEWFLFEGLYFVVQFSLLAVVFALIHRSPQQFAHGV